MKTSSIHVILSVVGTQRLGRCIVEKQQNSKGFVQRSLSITLSLVSAIAITLLIWKLPQQQSRDIADHKDRGTLENAYRSTLVQAIGGIFFFVTAYFAQQNLIATQEKQVTERFATAIEQLGDESIHVRIGAIYALERIAKDSDKDYSQVMEVLTAYVRERSPYPSKEQSKKEYTPFWAENNNTSGTDNQKDIPPITTDIQAVLTVIGRRTKSYRHGEENTLDLGKNNLSSADLSSANLSSANLIDADLSSANLSLANLSSANLSSANLSRADLSSANLSSANLIFVNLSSANLSSADLSSANLSSADLSSASLKKVKNLTLEQLEKSESWNLANYDPEVREYLGLPPEEPQNQEQQNQK